MGQRQRTLVIRRFGAMSFGIGYYEDGVWIDHASGDPADDPWGDVHGWYGCCARGDGEPERLRSGIAILGGTSAEPWRADGAPAGDAVVAN